MVVSFHNYQPGDVYLLDIREDDTLGMVPQDQPFPAWTMKEGDEVLACGGIVNAGNGIGNLWLHVADKARGHALPLFRFARGALEKMFNVMQYHRIQTVIRTDKPEYVRWALMFGFEKEAVLRKAAPSQDDLFLFSKVI